MNLVSDKYWGSVVAAGWLLLLAGCTTHVLTGPGPWQNGVLSVPGTPQGPPVPKISDIAQLQPVFPPGRRAWIDRWATDSHEAAVHQALDDPYGFPVQFPARQQSGDRVGVLVLHNGDRLDYVVRNGSPKWLYLRFPTGDSVVLRVPRHDDDEDEN